MITTVTHCGWCGREVVANSLGRRRRYCQQSCRQRAYEQRHSARSQDLPDDAVVLRAEEVAAIADRSYAVRCAAEDVATAVAEGVGREELVALTGTLIALATDAERLR